MRINYHTGIKKTSLLIKQDKGVYNPPMKVTVNGKELEISEGTDIAGLLKTLGLDRQMVAVEHNRKILPPDSFSATMLTEGDELEIVGFVGGG